MKTKQYTAIVILCVICAATLMSGCINKHTAHDGTFEIDALGAKGFHVLTDGEWTMEYEIRSDQPVTVYVMTRQDYDRSRADLSWQYQSKMSDVYTISESCRCNGDMVLMVENNNWVSDAMVYVKVDAIK